MRRLFLRFLRDESGARGTNAAANQINNRGEVVGMSETTAFDPNCPAPQIFQFKPVVWIEGKVHELPINSSDPDGIALAINDNGEVAGMSGVCSTFNVNTNLTNLNGVHALVWEHKKAIDLGNLGGTNPSPGGVSANSINNLGQVVGSSELSDNLTFHAFLWNKRAGMQDLGTLPGDSNSVGLHINDDGEVSGVSLDANFSPRAFLVRGGRMYDLNDLVPADSPLFLLDACFINNKGEIVGFGVDKTTGEAHGFMAEPKYW